MFIWTISDAITLGLVSLVLVVVCGMNLLRIIQEGRCPHDGGVNETSACDAICRKCGKNLGFIGTWRKEHQ